MENNIGFLARFKDTTMTPALCAKKLWGLTLLASLEINQKILSLFETLKKRENNFD
jgi:hypothetical protein